MNRSTLASTLTGIALSLAACGTEQKPLPPSTRAPIVAPAPPVVPIEMRVARDAARITGIETDWDVRKADLGHADVPLCNCLPGEYFIAVAPNDTARVFFSKRGEYLSSAVFLEREAKTRRRRFASPDQTIHRVQRKVDGQWLLDFEETARGDTVVRTYNSDQLHWSEELGRPLFEVRTGDALKPIGRYAGLHGGDSQYHLTSPDGRVRVGRFFEVFEDQYVRGEHVGRTGTYFSQRRTTPSPTDSVEDRQYNPLTKRFVK